MTPLILALGSLSLAAPQQPVGSAQGPRTVLGPVDPHSPAPSREGLTQYLKAGPEPSLQSFLRLPSVRPVGPSVEAAGEAKQSSHTGCYYDFARAAHFPVPRYDQMGNSLTRDGLLIYEGMRLIVHPDGAYDVEFTATVPNTPVTIHLQLVLTPRTPQFEPLRITLPPIRLEPPSRTALGDPAANTFHVNHRGYFVHFDQARSARVHPLPFNFDSWEVARYGTARFGTPVAVDDLGR